MAGPFIIPDIYELDPTGAMPPFEALARDPRVAGVILKATQGVQYAPAWFVNNWNRAKVAGVRGAYHFGMPTARGDVQADFCLALIDKAGGLAPTDMPIAWDLESSSNTKWSSAQQIVDISSQFADRIKQRTGKTAVLYAGALIRDMGLTNHMGFGKLWTPHLDMSKAGWPTSSYALWQYSGGKGYYDPRSAAYGLPLSGSIPGWPSGTDMSVVMDRGGFAPDLAAARAALGSGGGIMPWLLLAGAVLALHYFSKDR